MVKRSSKQREMVVEIYDSADGARGHKPKPDTRDTKRDPDTAPHTRGDTAWSRWYRLIAVFLVMLCLLLTAVIVLWIKYPNLNESQTSNNNLTIAREQLQTCNNNLNIAKDQLQRERAELQRFSKLGWNYFSSSVYIFNTGQKSWTESRENCSKTGADLVIITSREEQEFVNKLRGGRQAWIGLSNRENKWKWVDDTTLITGFWEDKEPNSAAGDRCVITGKTSDPVKNWAEYPCNKTYNWICEKKIFN